ncbi:MAG TPA: metallophosphoesterase [Methanosarcina sp.]|nr:metallophosphoesterase [Methanosarcina sp.]
MKQNIMKKNTIILLVGPSNCGKSTFAKKLKINFDMYGTSSVIISSDEIRRELLCNPKESKMSARMMSVSNQAFQLLNQRVEMHTSYPVNSDFVIIDSTALSQDFRNEMIAIAEKNHYSIELFLFDFPRSDLEKFVEQSGDGDMFVTGRHMKKLREEVMPNLNRKAYSNVTIFKKPEEASNWKIDEVKGTWPVYLNNSDKIAVIGDVHECVQELQSLVEKLPADLKAVAFLGDIFDKGGQTEETLNYIISLTKKLESLGIWVFFIKGNHERYVYKRLMGILQENAELESNFFQSYKVLQANEDLKIKFIDLFHKMHDTLTFHRGNEKSITLTHAPCSNLYLDKADTKSSGKQINFYFTSRDQEKMLEELSFVEKEANYNHPWHLFGHVAHDGRTPKMIKNKIYMDTGCVHGGKLSAAIFNGRHVDFITVDSSRPVDGMISLEKKETNLEKVLRSDIKLSDEDEKLVRRVIKGGAKFVSGTMAPAPAMGLDIESLEAGLAQFKNADMVIIEPKYMGSRCQFYLHSDRSKNFATSRNGFRIRIPGIEDCMNTFQDWLTDHMKVYYDVTFDEIVLDGELLPWSALGKGLIEGSFEQYHAAAEYVMQELQDDDVFAGFDIAKKINPSEKIQNLAKFKTQLELYGSEKPMEFKAFSVLSKDGVVEVQNNLKWFCSVNDYKHGYRVVDPKTDLEEVQKYFDTLVFENGFEGIVIKPVEYDGTTPPYMKVRNKEYLRLVYGFDYTSRLEELCKQKSIKHKLKLSIDEFELGIAMLNAKTDDERNHLIAAMFGQIAKEKTLDPRL